MRFIRDGRMASLDFDSQDEFMKWVTDRVTRARAQFPGEIGSIGAVGPLSVSRMILDDEAQIEVMLEGMKAEFKMNVVGFRMPLDRDLCLVQLEVTDVKSGMVVQQNLGREAAFARIDTRPAPAGLSRQDAAEADAKAIARFAFAYTALGRSRDFDVSTVAPAKLKRTRKLFAGFCPLCDGLLQWTGVRVDEHDNLSTVWEARCLDCNERVLGWIKGDGHVPPGWKRISST